MKHRVLVVGGTGSFGQRLVEGLLATTDVTVIVAGRAPQRHDDVVRRLRERYEQGRVETASLDRNAALEVLLTVKPFCVVDAAGPFQHVQPHLAQAAIAAGCHYVDLADARDFVAGFGSLDAPARQAGVLAATGASSTPALSGAAVEHITAGWRQVDEISVAISPGNRAPRGASVVEAILAYAGQPVRVWIDGRWSRRRGWGELVRRDMPGLGPRWLSLCETPDLDLLPARYPSVHTVRFRAGLELPILHLGLWLLTLPVRWGWIRSLRPFARFLQKAASGFERFGTDRGGMCVRVQGRDEDGRLTLASWTLVAEAGDGPNIPALPALALIRAMLNGRVTDTGARNAGDLLPLAAIEAEFARFRISVRHRLYWPQGNNLLEKALGPAVEVLPPLVREIHTRASVQLLGRAAIDGAQRWAGQLIARLFGLPRSTSDAIARVLLQRQGDKEVWIRRFGRSTFRSTLRPGPPGGCLYERFGPFEFELDMTAHESGFELSVIGWQIGPVRLPLQLAPRAPARAFVDAEGRYGFDVAISLPLVGQLVRYRGWLLPE